MKNNFLINKSIPVLIIIACFLFAPSLWAGQDQDHEKIVEKVTVTNIEVPVRVLDKGVPVTDLTKDDFTIYENKKKMEINGFFLKRKKISLKMPGETGDVEKPKKPALRTFVLVFNVTNYNDHFKKAVDYLFDNILRETDRIMIFANDKTREYPNLKNKQKVKKQLITDLQKESMKVRNRLLEYIKRIEAYLNVHDFRRTLEDTSASRAPSREVGQQLIDFLKKYLIAWNEYKKKYLTPRVDRFYYFSRYLEKLKTEKWVLNFYQFELFPRIRIGSRAMNAMREIASQLTGSNNPTNMAMGQVLQKQIAQLNTDLNLNKGFPNEEVSKLFYKVDATFHSFFIRTNNPAFLQDFDYKSLSTDIEQVLKGITDITGGENITSDDLAKSLEHVSEKEDVYYILTYAPKDPKKTGKLKIKVKNKKYKVLYDDNFRNDYINEYFGKLEKRIETPDVKIKDFAFKRKILTFTVTDFLMAAADKKSKKTGRLNVRIRVTDKNNNPLYDKSNAFTAQKNEMKLSLSTFKTIIKGEYVFIVDVTDMLTGKDDSVHENIIVK